MKMSIQFHAAAAILACAMSLAYAYDPSPLQDFCVAINDTDPYSAVFVNGKFCKNPKLVRDEDFFFSGLSIAGNTSNPVGSIVTFATVEQFPGLNTLGIALVRIDYALNGLNPPHSHPRASEFFLVLEGTIYAAFVTSNPEHRLFSKVLNPGDVFLIPQGLIHFQLNVGKCNAVAIAGFNGQFPGVVTTADTVFGSKPLINPDVLAKAFRLDRRVIEYLQAQFGNSQKIMSFPANINEDH